MSFRGIAKIPELEFLQKWIIIGILLGIIAGSGAIAFYASLEFTTSLLTTVVTGFDPPDSGNTLEETLNWHPPENPLLLIPVITIACFISGLIVYGLAPEAEGHGTDAAIASFHKAGGEIRTRIPIIKTIASSLVIGSGGSAGREGPTAQISAGIGSLVAKLLKLSVRDRRIAVAVGIGAGVGSIFKAPLGGAILAAEILYIKDFETDALMPGFVASTVGYVVFCTYHGYEPTFSFPDVIIHPVQLPFFALTGLICGFFGILYVTAFYRTHEVFSSFFKQHNLPVYLKPAVGALITGLLAVTLMEIFPDEKGAAGLGILGMGYGFLQLAMYNMLPLKIMFLIGVAKILSTSFTIGSGGSGGVFAPGLVIGGMVGGATGAVLHSIFPTIVTTDLIPAFVAVGMIALFGGISKAPIAVMIMICEMTGNYSLFFPAMVSVAISYIITGKRTIYIEQVETKADSPAHRAEMLVDVLEDIKVREAMVPEDRVVIVSPHNTILDVMKMVEETGHIGYPVMEKGEIVGIITFEDIEKVPVEERAERLVRDVMTEDIIHIHEDDSLEVALKKLVSYDIGRLPVVDRHNKKKLIGLLTRSDIMKAHAKEVAELGR
ncbi:MAG TPA: CBS domain-containing protein [Archaeoglobaceae archaeon]|nr:CBS domain-containing protein [Archaeoglobaceae archaeon]